MIKISLEVRVPKEITEYKEKILFGLSIRQLFSFIFAILIGFLSYYLSFKFFGKDVASYVVILITMPVFAFGFFKKDGFTFEKYIVIILRQKLGNNKRIYKTGLSILKIEGKEGEIIGAKKTWKRKRRKGKTREAKVFEIRKKDTKRKGKEIKRKIKTARKQYKVAKQRIKKEAKEKKVS
ncbi:PrgI family protein [Tissierella pigra]|uniref:PrgI family mobile element protein n=1 Tax=Tissierella pigra TaxID=2607614 RepID=UPI001C110776|nr:PrgI family protein [Tissierella pigra]